MHHPRRRSRRGGVALAALVLLLVPAAIAWACNPQAYIRTTQSGYGPGAQVVVQGAFFKANKEVILNLEPGGEVARVTTASNGSFQTSFRVPRSVGSYSVSAVSFEPDGTVTNGLPARTAFEVAQPAALQRAPASTPAPPATTQGGERAFVLPGITRSPTRSGAPTGGSGDGGGGSGSGGGGGGGQPGGGTFAGLAGGTVTGATGVPVFAGSVAPAQATFGSTPAVAAQGAPASAAKGAARSTGRAAAADSDVWSGFTNGRTPSLTSDAADAPDSGTGSGLGLGIGLLALGLLALVAGLTAAEVQRRRKAVSSRS
jgi:hypothetical protein